MSKWMLSLAVVALALLACSAGVTETLTVPAQYSTIPAAVTAAASGDTIEVASGTYVYATTITVNKSLTISGAGAGSTFVLLNPMPQYGYVFDVRATSDVTISDMTIGALNPDRNNGYYIGSGAGGGYSPTANLKIQRCAFGTGRSAILAGGTGLVVDSCVFSGERMRGSIRPTGSNFTITNNVFTDLHYQYGPIIEEGGTLSGLISGNTFSNGAIPGYFKSNGNVFTLEFYGTAGANADDVLTITDNTFDGVTKEPTGVNQAGNPVREVAIYFENLASADAGKMHITGNDFTGYNVGAIYCPGAPVVTGNSFTANGKHVGLWNISAADADTAIDSMLGANTFDRHAVGKLSGFYSPNIWGTLQPAVSAVGDGDEVIAAGDFTESISVGGSLTLTGDGASITPASGDTLTLSAGSDGATIDGFDIRGSARGVFLNGLDGDTITLTDCTLAASLSEFVVLQSSSADVNATSATFSGAADDAAKEAKVYHDVDDAALGHVDWGQGAATATAIVASDVTGTVGQTVQLSAKLTSGGAPVPGASVAFAVDGTAAGSGTTDGAGVAAVPYAISAAGNKTITASFRGVTNYKACIDTAALTVNAAAPTAIVLTVTPGSVTSGQTATCTVVGDNGVDYTGACSYYAQYGAGGSWAGNVYTSAKAGTWNLTAVYNTLTDSKPLVVAAGAATSVTLTPATATINAGDSQAYVVTATDAAGNVWNPVGVIAGGAGTWAGNTYTSLAAEAGSALTMTATVGAESATATLNINAAAGPGTILAWDKDTQKFYLCSNATDPQTGTEITGSGDYGGTAVVVSGGGTNVTVTVGTSSLRVTWYMRSGALYRAYQYSTTTAGYKTATYDGRRTLVDGTWKTGFWGLTHTIDGANVTYGSAQQ